MSAPLLTLTRYLVSWGCVWLVSHGWTIANLDGASMDAVASIVIGVGGSLSMAAIGMWTSTVGRVMARLQARHKTALVAEAAKVPSVQSITADAALADAIPSDKVVAS